MKENFNRIFGGVCAAICIWCVAASFVGCKNPNAAMFQSESLAAKTALASVHAFNVYYSTATNGATEQQIQALTSTQQQVWDISRRLSSALGAVEILRATYQTNGGETNRLAMLTAMQAVNSQSTNLTAIVKQIIGR